MSSRGKNFTERERCKLMELVQKYKHIIENKCTNAVYTLKKNEAWEAIMNEFNSTAEVPRTTKQLTTAYLNMKRTTRQNIANENIQKYLEQNTMSTEMEGSIIHNQVVEVQELIKQLKKDEVTDRKGVMATGGGVHRPMLTSSGAQMLAIMGDQVKPLSNSCDSASNYFINDEIPSCSQDNSNTAIAVQPSTSEELPVPKTNPIPSQFTRKHKLQRDKMSQKIKQVAKQSNINTLKRQYYQKKLDCVNLEKKNRILEYKMNLKKHKLLDLEIKLKQLEYDSHKK